MIDILIDELSWNNFEMRVRKSSNRINLQRRPISNVIGFVLRYRQKDGEQVRSELQDKLISEFNLLTQEDLKSLKKLFLLEIKTLSRKVGMEINLDSERDLDIIFLKYLEVRNLNMSPLKGSHSFKFNK